MRKWLLIAAALACGALLATTNAEAKRLGASRSIGAQRSIATPPASAPARPAQATPAGQAQTAPAPAQAAPPSRWLPLLGGLALGGMLGALFGGGGLGGLLLVMLLAIAAVAAFRVFAARAPSPAFEPTRPAAMPGESGLAEPSAAPRIERAQAGIPAGFDTAAFLRSAKLNFVRLQLANDGGKLDEIREFTTQDMYDTLRRDIVERADGGQQTDVVSLDADLLELATEEDRHWASVRFSGTVREAPGAPAEGFEEVWNLVKPADGSTGWLLAGIQQMH